MREGREQPYSFLLWANPSRSLSKDKTLSRAILAVAFILGSVNQASVLH